MFHVILSSLATRALEHGLDHQRFPGRTTKIAGHEQGTFLWETRAQAERWRERMVAQDGGRYEILTVDADGLELERDPAIAESSWFTRQPIPVSRITRT
jgi:hypothetical protein